MKLGVVGKKGFSKENIPRAGLPTFNRDVRSLFSTDKMRTADPEKWTTVWTAMPQRAWAVSDHLPPKPFVQFADTTLRQTVRVPGDDTTRQRRLRLRLTNAFGTSGLVVTKATVGIPRLLTGDDNNVHDQDDPKHTSGSRFVDNDSLQPVLFSGQPSVTISAGNLLLSDPFDITLDESETLTVTLYFADGLATDELTTHPGSRTQSWLCKGDQTESASLKDGDSLCSVHHWYFLSGVEELSSTKRPSLVLIGDSITDGRCSTDNGNDRWPDLLLQRARSTISSVPILLNQAAGGNCVFRDGTGGPPLLSRLDRDVLSQPGVAGVLLFAGVNDIGTTPTDEVAQQDVEANLVSTLQEVAQRCHEAGLYVFISTIAPFCGPGLQETPVQSYSSPAREATRQRVNTWIREASTTVFDGLVDFDAVLRNPDCPGRLLPAYDSGDYLHPNVTGLHAMADAFPLKLLEKRQPVKRCNRL